MPPTRHALSTHLLEAEYQRVQDKVKQVIHEANCRAVISDGWTNVRGEAIVNYLISTPQPVFFKCVDTKDKQHTKEFIAKEIKSVIEQIGSDKVFAVITDNAANMKAAWNLIQEDFPLITVIGCAAHALNLLLSDIMKLRTIKNLDKQAKKVIKYVKQKQIVLATFSSKQKGKGKNSSLKLPSKTRWGGIVLMLTSLLDGKESLQELVIIESLAVDKDVRQIILDNEVFWLRVKSSLHVLEPMLLEGGA